MAPTLSFYADGNNVRNLQGSGLGFFGSSFGASVAVGSYQDSTFITNAAGTSQGGLVDNIKFLNAGSGIVNSVNPASGYNLRTISYKNSTLQIKFETNDSTPVQTQNGKVYIYDRVSTSNAASGVTTKVAEIRNMAATTPTAGGSGSATWVTFDSSTAGSALAITSSPGPTGFYSIASGATVHDWYLAISASPNTIGSKSMFGLAVTLEYF